MRPHIVILGAGFGGMYVAKKLKRLVKKGRIDLTIVSKTNYFLFTPLLHEVATGGLSPRIVAEPLREIFARTGVRIVQAEVSSIDQSEKKVIVKSEMNVQEIPYDFLVIATGAEPNYFGVKGAEEHTFPLKSIMDAALIRSRVIDQFEQALLEPDPGKRKKLLSFAVVGGGATGVELGAELSEFINGMVRRYYGNTNGCSPANRYVCRPEEPVLTLIHMGKELLEMFSPKLRSAALKRLSKNGVIVRLNTTVSEVTLDSLKTNGDTIVADTVIWTAGVKPIVPVFKDGAPVLGAGGRMVTDAYFNILNDKRVFALGDAAAYVDSAEFAADSSKARPLPMLAQVAEAQSKVVAANIRAALDDKPLRALHYKSKGGMVSVGQWFAIGEIFSLHIAGPITWWIWRTVYLFKFASWQKRVRIAFEWTLDLFYPRDITKLM